MEDGECLVLFCEGCGLHYMVRLEITYDYVCEALPAPESRP